MAVTPNKREHDAHGTAFRFRGIVLLIDRNKPNISAAEIVLNVVSGVDGIPTQTGQVSLCQPNTKFFTDARGGQQVFLDRLRHPLYREVETYISCHYPV